MNKFPIEYAQALYDRFSKIFVDKFVKSSHDEKFISGWWQEWSEGLEGIDATSIKDALQHCRMNLDWPPSIAEFRRICEQSSGIPTAEQAMAKAIRGEFDHPVVAIAYDKVGSWAMRNSKEAELLSKFKAAYQEALAQFRSEPTVAYLRMKTLNEHRSKALPVPPPKIPSQTEVIGWRERLARYKEMAAADKLKLEKKDHPVWDKKQIMPGNRFFDQKVFDDRRKYLMELDEMVASTLPVEDWYDRTHYLRELASPRHFDRPDDLGCHQVTKTSPRAFNSPLRVVK